MSTNFEADYSSEIEMCISMTQIEMNKMTAGDIQQRSEIK